MIRVRPAGSAFWQFSQRESHDCAPAHVLRAWAAPLLGFERDVFAQPLRPWSWVPHRASLVRDNSGGFVCRHCERSEAIHGTSARKMDCFAALAMTGVATAGKN